MKLIAYHRYGARDVTPRFDLMLSLSSHEDCNHAVHTEAVMLKKKDRRYLSVRDD